jgi:hypothetical protein
MRRHLKLVHSWTSNAKGGRLPKAEAQSKVKRLYSTVINSPVSYQTFHRAGFVRYFQVAVPNPPSKPEIDQSAPPVTLASQVEYQLAQKLQDQEAVTTSICKAPPEPSGWLQTTEWIRYLEGHDLKLVAQLIALPYSFEEEGNLIALVESFDRVIEMARDSISQGKVNAFDQQRVNSFLRSQSRTSKASDRPLAYKLKEQTYKTYKGVWKRLLCFVYRLAVQESQLALHYALTNEQSVALDKVATASQVLVQQQKRASQYGPAQDITYFRHTLDQACLQLCIVLLDHRLMGNLYDSIVVGFLAVLGIDKAAEGFEEATSYTSHLSALIKMAQLLVVQRAVVAAETGETEYPAQMLEVMQDRFMTYGSRSPINWAQKLRVYGKKIRDTTTSLGFIIWSDDGQKLSYKELELSMFTLKQFIRHQVNLAQDQLEGLLLLGEEEVRGDVVPEVRLPDLKDDSSLGRLGQSFLTDPRNSWLQGYDRWLLNRVLKYPWLQEQFFQDVKHARWKISAVESYLQQIDDFLKRLLLLVYITSGQPARGTELLTLQYCNSANGRRRNIFMENGLITFVTFCLKGYNILNSTKVIHRYLPQEISELLVYYLWLVLPFSTQLKLLALNSKQPVSPYLWAAKEPAPTIVVDIPTTNKARKPVMVPCWDGSHLRNILQQEFKACLNTTANITLWRHAAIAISRKHLNGAKFKRDYDSENAPTWSIEQTGHTAIVAGNVYARGIEEAPGHVAAARAEYRALSRQWHSFFGFSVYIGTSSRQSLKRPLGERDMSEGQQYKRICLDDPSIEAEVQRRVKQELSRMTF